MSDSVSASVTVGPPHVHDWTAWLPSPLSESLGVERRKRECRTCELYQDVPWPLSGVPDSALGRCQAMLQCHRETGHEGGHEAREEAG
jgi:hypothetical protein